MLSTDTGYNRDYRRNPYPGYERSGAVWFRVSHRSIRHHPKKPVIGVVIDGAAKAYPFYALAATDGDVAYELAGHRIRVHFDRINRTGTVRNADTGAIPSAIACWFAWYAFYPDTALFP